MENLTLNVGVLVGLLTDGQSDIPPVNNGDASNNVIYDFDNDLVTALNISAKVSF